MAASVIAAAPQTLAVLRPGHEPTRADPTQTSRGLAAGQQDKCGLGSRRRTCRGGPQPSSRLTRGFSPLARHRRPHSERRPTGDRCLECPLGPIYPLIALTAPPARARLEGDRPRTLTSPDGGRGWDAAQVCTGREALRPPPTPPLGVAGTPGHRVLTALAPHRYMNEPVPWAGTGSFTVGRLATAPRVRRGAAPGGLRAERPPSSRRRGLLRHCRRARGHG